MTGYEVWTRRPDVIAICRIGKGVANLTRFFFACALAGIHSVSGVEPATTDVNAAVKNPVNTTVATKGKKLLFLPFHNEAGDTNLSWLETSIGLGIHEAARKKYRYTKIDDDTFARYFAAKGYTTNDLSDFDKITKIARELGADGVVYGTFRPDATKVSLVVAGKILSVIDQEIVGEKTLTMPVSAEMFSAVDEVSRVLGENIRNLFFRLTWAL